MNNSLQEKKDRVAPDWLDQVQPCTGQGGLERTHSKEKDFVQSSKTHIVRRKAKRRDESPLALCRTFIVHHQIGLSLNLLILLVLTHTCFPRARRHTSKFIYLSHYNEETGEFRAGWNDAWMVAFWILIFTFLRAVILEYVLTPLGQLGGISGKKSLTRFAEQGWLLLYYSVFWPVGMFILYNSDYLTNFNNLWTNWPNRELGGIQKWYILAQYAFWLQQIMVINIEQRRKDHWQMFCHHIITCTLLFNAYAYHQTKVANFILCIMDVVDLFLPAAKCLKYLGYTRAPDVAFAMFMAVWVAARHVLYIMVCWSVYHDLPIETDYGCYKGRKGAMLGPFDPPDNFHHLLSPFTDPEGVVCFNNKIKWAFLTPLLLLQGITIMWFFLICRVAVSVIKGGREANDPRSDDEEELEDAYDEAEIEQQNPLVFAKHATANITLAPLEEEVGVESINLTSRRRSSSWAKRHYNSKSPSSSGVHIPGNIARKELLDRIGCDKPID